MARERAEHFDVVHSHLDYLPFLAFGPTAPALVTTLHGRLDHPESAGVYRLFRDRALVSISDAQRRPLPDLRWIATVHHGLPLDDYPLGDGTGGYAVFLGRFSPEKRAHVAIDCAARAGMRLLLAAKRDPVHRAYFDDEIAPRLRQKHVEWVGETDLPTTIRLLQDARVLCFPILWPEPFGLAMIEAMACGTPVVTRRCGSAPEVVADGTTGFVCDDDDAVVDALRRATTLDRTACRAHVAARFTVATMADGYERAYERCLEERPPAWKTSSAFTTATTSSRPRSSPTTALGS
jgi:glycosyltransferase involved in cell wall biosynthesis